MSTMRSLIASTIRQEMINKKLVCAGWVQSVAPLAVRALSRNHRYIVLDAEHGGFSMEVIPVLVEVASNNGALCIVRVPLASTGDQDFARRCLDAGAVGILFPNVRSPEDAMKRISACYYPTEATPWGTRGFGFGGCNEDGHGFGEYAKVANDRIIAGVQLENKDAFEPETLAAILATPGLIFTQDGPYDHSGSYLVPGQTSDERVVEDLRRYRDACKKAGVVSGKHVVWPTQENIRGAVNDGYGFLALGVDQIHIMDGAKLALETVEKAVGGGHTD